MANKKLALTAGHYYYTSGKRCLKSLDPAETREWWLNDRIADKIEKLLSKYQGIDILRTDDTTGKTEVTLAERVKRANNFNADFYLSIHHNAGIQGGSGGGIVIYTIPNATTAAVWQKKIYNSLIAKTGLKGNRSNPLGTSNLYECKYTNMSAVLCELGFMDSRTDTPIILTEDYANKCAEAITEVIVSEWGLKLKPVETPIAVVIPDPPKEDTKENTNDTATLTHVYEQVKNIAETATNAQAEINKLLEK